MTPRDLAGLFAQTADLLEFRGDNPFRIRAYRRAAQTLETTQEDLVQLAQQQRLTELPGIGRDLADKIQEYVQRGSIADIQRLQRAVPAGILDILAIPGVGPKTARLLYERLNIASVAQLQAAASAHRLQQLPGFQATKEANILKGIALIRQGRERMDLGTAWVTARGLMEALRPHPNVLRIEPAGSLRRMKETIGDLDLLVASRRPEPVMQAFIASSFCRRVLALGLTKSSILTPEGLQVDLRVVKPDSFGAAWQYFTGSKEHNVRLRELASRKGLKINEYGIFQASSDKRLGGREEADIYDALGLPWIPPELREDQGELDAARERRLPALVELADIKGDFHIHTNRTDGRHSLDDVIAALRSRGYAYAAITDHSRSLRIAHGLSESDMRDHLQRIRALAARLRTLRILAGSEVDILEDGRLDYPDTLLREMDFVIGSIHSGFKQSAASITARLTAAMSNRYVTVIGHPTGRLLGQREPYAMNMEEVCAAARRTQTALEINASSKRLDLNDQHARRAKACGVRLALSTDTHALDQLDNMAIGVGLARRAWLEPPDLLNCLSRVQLMAWIRRKRERPEHD